MLANTAGCYVALLFYDLDSGAVIFEAIELLAAKNAYIISSSLIFTLRMACFVYEAVISLLKVSMMLYI